MCFALSSAWCRLLFGKLVRSFPSTEFRRSVWKQSINKTLHVPEIFSLFVESIISRGKDAREKTFAERGRERDRETERETETENTENTDTETQRERGVGANKKTLENTHQSFFR